jgi:hypothetical protein
LNTESIKPHFWAKNKDKQKVQNLPFMTFLGAQKHGISFGYELLVSIKKSPPTYNADGLFGISAQA